MKRLIIGLIALLSFVQAFSQGNDSTKYVYYRYTYGNRLARYWADTVLQVPNDTIWSKDGIAIKGGIFYIGNHVKWTQVTGSGGTTDTLAFATWQRLYKTIDSMHLVNDARYRTPTDTSYAHFLMTRLWGYKIADSLGALISAGGASFANPTATIGLTAVNGSLSTAMRSDAAPPIDTSSTGLSGYYVRKKFSPFPAERPFGTLYDQSFWVNDAGLTIFTPLSGTNSSTLNLTNGTPIISSTAADWKNVVLFNADRTTLLSHLADTVWCTVTSPITANSTGGGLVFQSLTPGNVISYKFYVNTSNFLNGSLNGGSDAGGSIGSAVSGTTVSQNDQLQMALTRTNDSTLVFSYRNLTTGSAWFSFTVNFGLATTGVFFPMNTGAFGFLTFSQTSGATVFSIQRIKLTSGSIKYPSNLFAGTSKTAGIGGTDFNKRFVSTLGATYPTCVNYGDGAGTLAELLKRRDEILATNPQIFVLEHCNDERFGYSKNQIIAMINEIAGWFKGRQTQFYITVFPEDSTAGGIGLTALKNYDSLTFGTHYIDNWNRFTAGGNICLPPWINSDGIHPKQVMYTSIDSLIRAKNILITADPARFSPYNTYQPDLTPIADSFATVYKMARIKNRLLRVTDSLDIGPSIISDNGAKIIISTNQNNVKGVLAGAALQADGAIVVSGTGGAILAQDRNDPGSTTNAGGVYEISHLLVLSNQAADMGYINSTGQLQWGAEGSGRMNGIFQIRKSSYTPPNTIGGFNGTVFNSDSIPGGIAMPGTTVNFVSSNDTKGQIYFNPISTQHGLKSAVLHVQKNNTAGTHYILDDDISARFDGTVSIGELGGSLRLHTPADGSGSDSILVWSHSDSTVKKVAQSSIGGGGSPVIFSATAAGSTVSNTTTPTTLSGTGVGSRTIAANSLTVGKQIVFHGWIQYSTGVSNTTIQLSTWDGSSGLGTSFALPASQTNTPAEFNVTYTVITTGGSGTVSIAGTIVLNGVVQTFSLGTGQAFDTTISHTMDLLLTWTTASTSNSMNMLPLFTLKVE